MEGEESSPISEKIIRAKIIHYGFFFLVYTLFIIFFGEKILSIVLNDLRMIVGAFVWLLVLLPSGAYYGGVYLANYYLGDVVYKHPLYEEPENSSHEFEDAIRMTSEEVEKMMVDNKN